ncbi:hypothetical protein DPMN_087487 [Dreissena polymorpha]|uniref:Uncharacterized protein n=1 Tax=Dreissena polymorpha TaxID=45954 RepID=A0A9D4KSG7_DREPO|nr:hypothetical protein DPMN_087487 [Dreissena polymorpha]
MTFTSWVAPAVNFKISPTDSIKEQEHAGWIVSTEKSKIMVKSTTTTTADIIMNDEVKRSE